MPIEPSKDVIIQSKVPFGVLNTDVTTLNIKACSMWHLRTVFVSNELMIKVYITLNNFFMVKTLWVNNIMYICIILKWSVY